MLKMNSKGAGEMTILCLLEKVVSLSSFSRHTPPLPYPNPWIALFFLLFPEVVWCAVPQWASGLHSLHSPALPVDSLRSWRWWCATDPFQTAVPRFKSIIRPDVVSAHVHKMVLNNSRWHPPLKIQEISLWRLLLVHISECSFLYPPHDRFNCTLNRIEKAPERQLPETWKTRLSKNVCNVRVLSFLRISFDRISPIFPCSAVSWSLLLTQWPGLFKVLCLRNCVAVNDKLGSWRSLLTYNA